MALPSKALWLASNAVDQFANQFECDILPYQAEKHVAGCWGFPRSV